uniref:Uncharacterized protein n=1 Tax=Oryza meridionalis TaxID=40149 RepID=A0A0E0DBT1_9ORYZ
MKGRPRAAIKDRRRGSVVDRIIVEGVSGDLATGGPRVVGIGGAKRRQRPGDGKTSCGREAKDRRWGSWRASRRQGSVADRRYRGRVARGEGVRWRGDLPEGGRGDLVQRRDAEEARRDGEVERVARRADAEEARMRRRRSAGEDAEGGVGTRADLGRWIQII